jgi:2-oxoglutarate dehydrogenase E1 component
VGTRQLAADANGELVSALDGDWPAVEKVMGGKIAAKAVQKGESIDTDALRRQRAIPCAPHDDPRLSHARPPARTISIRSAPASAKEDHEELHPSAYGFTEADWDRKIFIDNVLGLEYATIREMLDILKRTYCSTIGVEFMHISNPAEKAWIQERIEGPDKGDRVHRRTARRRSSTS